MGIPPAKKVPKAEIVDQAEGNGWKLLLLVSPDHLAASVQMSRSANAAQCPAEKVSELVRGSKLRLSTAEDARLPELAQGLVGGQNNGSVVVAQGAPAEHWNEVDWLVPVGISALRDYTDETVDLHEVSHFINVRAGQTLCELPTAPKAGFDVFGQTIAPEPCPLQLGERVAFDEKNPARVLATEGGCVRFSAGRLSVEQHLEVSGDLDFKVGNIDFNGDVTIRGNVPDGFHVKSAKNILIQGGVGTSTIEAAGSVTIKGGVNGGHKGRLASGGDLHAHYLHMVSVECGADVRVDVECHDSTVVAAGSVTVSRGGIIAGKVLAGKDITAGFIGAEMCVPTMVCAGLQADLHERLARARKALADARALVKNVESALARSSAPPSSPSRHSPLRQSQTVQFQSRLVDARLVAEHAQADLAAQLNGTALPGATISSVRRIFPKVTVVIDSAFEEEISDELEGPVRLLADRTTLAIRPASAKTSK